MQKKNNIFTKEQFDLLTTYAFPFEALLLEGGLDKRDLKLLKEGTVITKTSKKMTPDNAVQEKKVTEEVRLETEILFDEKYSKLSKYSSFSVINPAFIGQNKKGSQWFVDAMSSYDSIVGNNLHETLNFNYVFIALNAAIQAQSEVKASPNEVLDFEFFHYNGWKNGQRKYGSKAYKLHRDLMYTNASGSYITDAIKGFSSSDGVILRRALEKIGKENGYLKGELYTKVLKSFGHVLKEELKLIGAENATLVFLGKSEGGKNPHIMDDFVEVNGFQELKEDNKILQVSHYSKALKRNYFTLEMEKIGKPNFECDKNVD